MKSEHRHELQTNELGRLADQAGVFFERYANPIMIGACAVALVAAGTIYWLRTTRARDANSWRDLAAARSAEQFASVWEAHPGTAAAEWARLQEGEARLAEGVQLSFTNLESAKKELEQARDVLQAAVDENRAPAEVRERALFALGRTLEALSDGSATDAVKAYHALVKEFPGSLFKPDAERRIAELDSGRGQEFYAWFATYPRPKAPELRPRDTTAASTAEESLELPDDDAGGEAKPVLETPALETPAEETPVKKPASDDKQSKSSEASSEAPGPALQPDGEPAPAKDEAGSGTAAPSLPNP